MVKSRPKYSKNLDKYTLGPKPKHAITLWCSSETSYMCGAQNQIEQSRQGENVVENF